MTRSETFTEYIAAPPAQVYRAFATAQGLQEWMADIVEADPRDGGRLYVWWNAGFYATGLYKEAVKDESVRFTWHAKDEPGVSEVAVTLEPRDGGTQLTLVHSGYGEGPEWETTRENHKREWASSLANLKAVLETGVDRRLYDRPMLGFFIGGLVDEAMQKRLNLPVDYGMQVAGTIAGMGAERSGLKQDDVIAMVDGVEVRTFQTIGPVLSKHKGGDVIKTVIYRDGQAMDLDVELSKRPVPAFPLPPAELAELARGVFKDVLKKLKAAIQDATEEETGRKPGEGEWSVREIMAHVLLGELWAAAAWDLHADDQKFPAFPGSHQLVAAYASTYSTKKLYKELKYTCKLLARMMETAPEKYAQNKAAYFLNANDFEFGVRNHWDQHTAQIQAALAAARETVPA
jgi:uncharacterized protein YndB with AHSA1/START domain